MSVCARACVCVCVGGGGVRVHALGGCELYPSVVMRICTLLRDSSERIWAFPRL